MHRYRRIFPRLKYEAPIRYAKLTRDHYYESRIYNFSKGGIYFQPDSAIEPESEVGIVMENYSPGIFGPEAYRFYLVRIKWCGEISDTNYTHYGAGAEIMAKSHEVMMGEFHETHYACDLCGRLMCSADLHKVEDSVFLCSCCHAHFKSIPDGHLKKCIKRFMTGNVI